MFKFGSIRIKVILFLFGHMTSKTTMNKHYMIDLKTNKSKQGFNLLKKLSKYSSTS